jgi:hypothetical protein
MVSLDCRPLFEARAVRARSALWLSAGGMIGSVSVIALVFALGYRITAERLSELRHRSHTTGRSDPVRPSRPG